MINAELGEFLRSRRARLSPEVVGIEAHGSGRRVAGLKREEVARLAGISVDYYVRMEQGRPVHYSESVLGAVGRALRLDALEQGHLNALASVRDRRAGPPAGRRGRREVLPAYQRIMAVLDDQPVFVTDWRLNVLTANPLALALYLDMGCEDPSERNFARFVFAHPDARALFVDWDTTAALTVGALRGSLAHHLDDDELADLIAELRSRPGFERLWTNYELAGIIHARKLYRHPVVGEVWIECDNVQVSDDGEQGLTIGTVEPGSPSETALRRLAGSMVMVPA